MSRLVEFTKDFANKSKGDKEIYDNLVASQLVHGDKVAKYVKESAKKAPKK